MSRINTNSQLAVLATAAFIIAILLLSPYFYSMIFGNSAAQAVGNEIKSDQDIASQETQPHSENEEDPLLSIEELLD